MVNQKTILHNSKWKKINIDDLSVGNIQGSILGPLLYSICVSALFHLTTLTNFADDNFIITLGSKIPELIENLQRDLEMIRKWLKDSGLVVNESKTELCLFSVEILNLLQLF